MYYQREDEIVWITDLDQLELPYNANSYESIPFLFSRFEVIDHTCNKCWKKTLSNNKANEWKQKKLATKKHANCDIEIVENNIAKDLDVDFSNVHGNEANNELYNKKWKNAKCDEFGNRFVIRKDLLTLKTNISMIVEITDIELDKNIITKSDVPMRLTVLTIKDRNNNLSKLTLFDAENADEFEVGTKLQLTDAQVNMRKGYDGRKQYEYPDGLNIPRWGSFKIFSGEMPKPKVILESGFAVVEAESIDTEPVKCEQTHCSKSCIKKGDEQFFCVNCDMELCAICIFEHKANYSLSGLTCDNEICVGSRKDNQF